MSERNILLKEWEKKEDLDIIKEVVTKGKYVNLCISFLSKRRKLNIAEMREVFSTMVYDYIESLLKNRQVFKAEHILKNVDENPKYFFYEQIMKSEFEFSKDFILDHLKKTQTNFEEEKNDIHSHWILLRFIKMKSEILIELSNEINDNRIINLNTLNLNGLYKQDFVWRQLIAINFFFKLEDTNLSYFLNKELVWNYFLKQNMFHRIVQWLDTLSSEITISDESNIDENQFELYLKSLFPKWQIDEKMLEEIKEFPAYKNESVLNSLAKHGYFCDDEKQNILKLIQRIMTSESFTKNKNILMEKEKMEKLINFCLDKKLFTVIVELFNGNFLENILSLDIPKTNEIELFLAIKETKENDNIRLTSKIISDFIFKLNPNFYIEKPFVYLFEEILNEKEVTCLSLDLKIISQLPHFFSFLNNIKSNIIENQTTIKPFDLINVSHKIDLNQLQKDSIDGTRFIPHFGNKNLSTKYSHCVKLTYLNYLRQYRSAYAVYLLFIDQLQNYAKITKEQIIHAAGLVSELAILNFVNKELVTHCVSFIEMLGFESVPLRAQLKCMNLVQKHLNDTDSIHISLKEFIEVLDKELKSRITNNEQLMNILPDLEAITIFCTNNNVPYPKEFLLLLAEHDNWIKFIVITQLMNYPIEDVIEMCNNGFKKNKNIGLNLIRAITYQNQTPKPRRHSSLSQRKEMTSSTTSTSSFTNLKKNNNNQQISTTIAEQPDLFSIILFCTNDNADERTIDEITFYEFYNCQEFITNQTTYLNLLSHSIHMKWPLLTILAGMQTNDSPKFCWIIWLINSIHYNEIFDNDFSILCENIIRYSVKNGFIRTLHESFLIFYPNSNFQLLTEFLIQTSRYNFSDEVNLLLQLYLVELSNNCQLFDFFSTNFNYKKLTFNLLMDHLINNFNSLYFQRLLLNCLCESDICINIDFCLLKKVTEIIELTEIKMNFNLFDQTHTDDEIQNEYEKICHKLVELKEFDKAIKLSELLNFDKENIIFENWIYKYEQFNIIDFDEYENEIRRRHLNPELLINFYLCITEKLEYTNVKKYNLLKKTLDTIKKYELYPNESFDRDNIEYEMLLSYIRVINYDRTQLEIYHSEFYERVLYKEKLVIFNTFIELKEIAGIEDLTIVNKKLIDDNEIALLNGLILKLLDKGDIIQALRLQGIFDQRPTDLHFIVFCMALSENIVSLYDLSSQERLMLSGGFKTGITKFNRRTLRTHRISQTASTSSSPRPNYFELSDNSGNMEFEEVPCREKQDILEAIQVLASRLTHGVHIAQRIVLIYRAGMYLFKEYVDLLRTKDPYALLKSAINEDCLHKLVVISDIMTSMKMESIEIAEFIGHEMSKSIIKSRFYLLQTSPKNPCSIESNNHNQLWGHNLDKEFHLFLDLCPNTILLGNHLLQYCDGLKLYRKIDTDLSASTSVSNEFNMILIKLKEIMENKVLSHKKQNIINVELIIKAHDCFVHECYMEGIVIVLQKAKILNNILSNAKSWNLIVRLLIGIGRYREMHYCFETLIVNHQFESLLGKFEDNYTNGLKVGIISYLHEHHPENTDFYRLAALHFCMYKELAEMWETEAKTTIAKLLSEFELTIIKPNDIVDNNNLKIPYIKCDTTVIGKLTSAMDSFQHAAENYLLHNKLCLAQKSATNAELVALQINLVKDASIESVQGNSICVLNITMNNIFRYFINSELSVPQSLILSRSYPSYEVNWADAIYNHYILLENENYLTDFTNRMELTSNIIENIVKSFQIETKINTKMEQSIIIIVEMVKSVTLKYKLASLLGLKKIIANLINEQSLFYLKDTDYGRNNI